MDLSHNESVQLSVYSFIFLDRHSVMVENLDLALDAMYVYLHAMSSSCLK